MNIVVGFPYEQCDIKEAQTFAAELIKQKVWFNVEHYPEQTSFSVPVSDPKAYDFIRGKVDEARKATGIVTTS